MAEWREEEIGAFEPAKDVGSRMWPRSPKQRVRGMVLFRLVAAECFFLIWNLGVKPGDAHSMRLEMLESIQKAGWQGGAQEQCWMRGWILQTTCKVRIWAGQDFFALTDSCGRVVKRHLMEERTIYYMSCASKTRKARGFFSQEKLHSKWFGKPLAICLSSRSLEKEGHMLCYWEWLTEPRRQWKVNQGQIDNKPMYCPFR